MKPFRATIGPALRVALVVGTVLNLVNYGEVMMQAPETPWIQLGINYLVPYCVATYSAMKI
jgi:hypothetical protein